MGMKGRYRKAYEEKKEQEAKRREAEREDSLHRQARRVYDEEDRSPDSDPNDFERPSF